MTYTELMNCMLINGKSVKLVCHDFRNLLSEYTYSEIHALEDIFLKVVSATNYALALGINVCVNFDTENLLCDAVQVITSYLDDMISSSNVLKYEIDSNSVTVYASFSTDCVQW